MLRSLRVGSFLAIRQVRANKGTTALIIVVMTLTFLDLLVVSGLMVGIVQGLRSERQHFYTSDILLTNFDRQNSISNSPDILTAIQALPEVLSVSPRYIMAGRIEANYQEVTGTKNHPDTILANVTGLD